MAEVDRDREGRAVRRIVVGDHRLQRQTAGVVATLQRARQVDGLLHVGELVVAERAGVVGDVVGQPERRLGRGGRSHQGRGRQDGGEQAEQTSEAHERQI